MQACSALGAEMLPDGQAFPDQDAAARTGLRGERWRHRNGSLPSVCCFESEDGAEFSPAGISDALGEGVMLHHVGHLQVFVVVDVVLLDQGKRLFMVEVLPLAAHCLLCLGE